MTDREERKRTYERSARLLFLLALRKIAPGAKVRFEHSIGHGIYMTLEGAEMTASLVREIESEMRRIQQRNLPIEKSTLSREEAMTLFARQGQEDTVRLLAYRPYEFFNMYTCDGLSEYFYGDMAKTTGEIDRFALRLYYPGMVLMLPEDEEGPVAPFAERPQLMRTYAKAAEYSKILGC